MNKYRWAVVATMALVCLGLAPRRPAADEKTPAADQATFKMKEISFFDQTPDADNVSVPMFGGVAAALTTTPAKEVKAYPKLNSPRPLYGTLVLNQDPVTPGNSPTGKAPTKAAMSKATKYYFVLDQSAPAVKATAKPEEKEPGDKSDQDQSGTKAKKQSIQNLPAGPYDLLYFDANHDLDLTNDPVVHLMKERPKAAARWLGDEESTQMFDLVTVALGEGRSVRGGPDLWNATSTPLVGEGQSVHVVNFMVASARQGKIRQGKKAYKATLSHANGALGRLDLPTSPLILTPLDGPKQPQSYGWMSTLGTVREADGEFYAISASPTGDRLFVRVFPGDRGVLEVSAGKGDIKEMGLTGILQFNGAMLPLGEMSYPLPVERARIAKYRLPVGDYQPMLLNVDYGRLQVSLRANYNAMAGAEKTPGGLEDPQGPALRPRFLGEGGDAVPHPGRRKWSSSRATPSGWRPCWRFRARTCSSPA